MRGKRRPPEERVANVAGPLPPCRVCGEQAAGFHYGVNTCEACKGFFRRSLLRNGEYECVTSGNCELGPNRRKSCPRCRYLKCLSVGMSKEAIKTGRYTYTKRTQDTLELQRLQREEYQDRSDLETEDATSSATHLAGLANHSFKAGNSHEDVSHVNSFMNKDDSKLSSDAASSLNISSDVKSVSSPDLNMSPLVTELSPASSSAESLSPLISSGKTLQSRRVQELKNMQDLPKVKIFSSLKSFRSTSLNSDQNIHRPQNAKLCSPLSAEEDSNSSQESLNIFHPCHTSACSSLAETTSASQPPSLLPSPETPCQLESSGTGTESEAWHIYSESELDEFISTIVSAHKMHVDDSNTISDEVLQEMFRECKERCSLQTEIFGHLGTIKKDEHDQIYASTGLDVDGRLDQVTIAAESMDVYIRQMIAFMKLIPGFRSLSLPDQTALVKASTCDLFILGYFRGYNRDDFIVVESARSYCRHEISMFESLEDIEPLFVIAQRLQKLHLTFEMVVILKALCVFFTDRATLEEPDTIEQLQFKIVQSLLLLLHRHFADKKSIVFAKIVSILAQTRSHEEYCRKFVLANMMSGSYRERLYSVPIVFELFNYHLNE